VTARLIECPNGHRVKRVPVIYGMPGRDLMADAEAGRVRLGGCDPTFEDDRVGDCPTCGAPIDMASRVVSRGSSSRPMAESEGSI
jgi:hypothetical protein